MSKAKKIISMLLAVLMVLSVVPASVFASAAASSAVFTKPKTELVTFSTDTSGTSEIIRVAGGEGMFTLGSTIVAATASGIPRADNGQFIKLAYAGETPTLPVVSFKITGVQPDKVPTVVSNLGSNITLTGGDVTQTGTGTNATYEYRWTVSAGGTATQGEVVTYTITYFVNGVENKAYAYSFVENILIMNGYVSHKYQNGGDHTPDTRHAYSVQVAAHNMYSGWYNNMAENIGRGFINYGSGTAMSGGSLLGTGTDPEGFAGTMEGYAVDDGVSTTGTPYGSMIKTISNQSKDDWVNIAYGLNGNRTESYLYIDKRTDTLDSLKFRVSLQVCDMGNDSGPWPWTDFKDVEILSGAVEFGSGDQWDMSAGTNTSYVNNKATSLIRIGEITKNVDTTRINRVSSGSNYVKEDFGWRYAWFGGAGPSLQNGTTKYQNTLLVYAQEMASNSNGETWNQEIGALGITFVVYNTVDLYNVFYGIMKGANINDGSASYTTSNYITYVANSGDTQYATSTRTINFTKGAHPQAEYYSGGWETFLQKYQAAGKVLSQPNTNQTEINKATVELIDAYNGLTGFNPTVTYTIKHVLSGTATEIANSSTEGYDAANQSGTVAAGTKITAYAAEIDGYVIDGDSTKQVTAKGDTSSVTITFNYTPKNIGVNAVTNNENLKEVAVTDASGNTEIKDLRTQIYPAAYGEKFYKSTATNGDGTATKPGVGTKPHWEFVDWYYQNGVNGEWDEAQRVPASFTIETLTAVTIYARWDTAPIHMYATPMLDDGTVINGGNKLDLGSVKPDENGNSVEFARPSADKTKVEGYLFVGFYETYNSGFQNSIEWPVTFVLGDNDKNIVARYADVNGKIVFESNGGTACSDFPFSAPQTINESELPVPAKTGYTFMGWYKDVELTQPVFADGATSITMNDATGFIAYAKWEAKDITINFDTAVGAKPSKYDTVSISPVYPVTVGQAVPNDMIPANPRRFGYEFAGWVYNNRPFDFSKVPVADESITLTATWRKTNESAFIELSAIEKVLGEEVYLDNNDSITDDDIVQHGDIITVRMTSKTNFYVGSSLFIFMYDSNFYELIGSGKDAFTLNPENDYIGGINAKYTAVTDSSILPWPDGLDSTNYKAAQIAIDPTVAVDNFNCEPMEGDTWMVEFKLRVKDTATGEGKIYMDNAWTRTPDNIMGTMFYGWAPNNTTSVIDTENNRVTPDLFYAERTLKIDTEENIQTKVTLDAADGVWADGTTENKVYEGAAGAEILDYVAPTRHGYDLDGWYATEGDTSSAKWIEGYYPPEDTLEATYYANWKGKEYPVIFHWDQGSDEIYKEIDVTYMSDIAADAVAAPTRQGYTFANWTDAEGNLVTLPSQMTVADENGYHLYATWTPATDTKFSIKVSYDNPNFNSELPEDSTNRKVIEVTQTQDKNRTAYQGTTGQTVKLVQSVPADADPNTLYITVDQLALVVGGNYVFDAEKYKDINEIDSDVIAADGSTVLEVSYVGKIMTFTFKANGGKFADGSDTFTKSGKFMSSFSGLADSELPTRDGYDLTGWSPAITSVTTYNGDRTFTAQWKAKAAHVRFMLSETEQYGDLVEVTVGSAPAAPTDPSKTGWTFVGWNTDPAATTGIKTLPAVTAGDSAEGYAITYYAIFSKTPYTITYILDGAPYGETETATMDTVINVKGAVEKTGYIFNGWMYGGNDVTGGTITMPASNIEITATYTAKTIKVKFYADEGAWTNGAEYVEVDSTFDGNINLPAETPDKVGYDFAGWAATADATEGSTSLGTLTAEEASFYAVYTPEKHTYYIDVYEMGIDGQYPENPTRTETAEEFVDEEVTITSEDNVAGFKLVTAATQTGSVPAEGDLRFTVKYERNKYTVVFKMEGKDDVTVTDYYGASVGADRVPDTTRVGYTFQNWLNTANEVVAIPVTVPSDNLELTANYKINTHTVKYYTDATKENLDRETTFNFNDDIAYVELYDSTGARTFLGWAYEGTTDIVVSSTATVKVPDADVVLVGIWKNNSFRLNYRGAAGIHEYFMVEYGTPVAQWPVPATNPAKEGSYFNGWSDSGFTTMPADAVTISPIFVTETYKLQFNETGDTTYGENNVITVTYGQAFDGVDNPEWAGHVFLDWDNPIPTEIGDLGDDGAVVEFTAQWRNEKYTLTFAQTGDTTIADKEVEFGDTIDAVGNPSWAGHVFLDWDKEIPTQIGDLGNDGAKITYTAQWRNEQYTLKFANTGDTVIADKNVEFGQTIAATPDPVWAGYVFAGWDVTPPTSIGDLGDDGATITYTAKWTKDTFTVTFDADNGTTADVVSKEFEAEVAAPAAPEKEGHVFSHWINTKDNSTVAFPFNMPAENLSLKAVWTKETYTLKFADTDDDGKVIEMNVTYGDTIAVPSGLTKTGHVFDKWDVTPPTQIGDLGEDKAVITYTAQWIKETYILKFVDTGDVTIEDKVVKFGDTIEVPTDLTKDGQGVYFLGTWKDADGNAATPPATIEDMGANGAEFTYVAQWAKETYTITFDEVGGTDVADIVKQYGDAVSVPANPTKEGHNFVQWNDAEGNKYDIQRIMPDLGENNAKITLTAQWTKKIYTVMFMDAYGDVFDTATIEFDAELSTIIPEKLPEKEHYITLGWSLTEGDTVAITEFGKMPANEALVYYPVLERVKVTLALTEGTTAETFEESIDETDPANPVKIGYIRGLDVQLTKADLEENYLGVTGDGELRITPSWSAFNICGTGTVVEVIDRMGTASESDDAVVERYYIVVYGDVNGDSGISATDVSAILREVNGLTGWSVKGSDPDTYNHAYVLAANLKADDGLINGIDASLLRDVTLSVAYIDQTTGTVINY